MKENKSHQLRKLMINDVFSRVEKYRKQLITEEVRIGGFSRGVDVLMGRLHAVGYGPKVDAPLSARTPRPPGQPAPRASYDTFTGMASRRPGCAPRTFHGTGG